MTSDQKALLLNWGNAILFFCFCFLVFYTYSRNFVYWDIFTTRDIMRAQAWLRGEFYWPGPEMSGGSNLPGPFFYFLLFPPLIGGGDIYTQSLLWYISWLSLTWTVAFSFLSKIVKHKESRLIFLIIFLFAIGNPLFMPLEFAWNPGFAILFHLLALIGLYYWRETRNNVYLYLVALVIALGIQVHLLVAVHILTVIFIFAIEKKRIGPLVLFFLLACWPFIVFYILKNLNAIDIASLDSVGFLLRLTKGFLSEKWIHHFKMVFISYAVIPFLALLFLTFIKKKQTQNWPFTSSSKNLLMIIAIPCLIAFLLLRVKWYTYFIPVFLVLFFSKYSDDLMPNDSCRKLNYLFVYVLFSIAIFYPYLYYNFSFSIFYSYLYYNFSFSIKSYPFTLIPYFFLILFLIFLNTKWTENLKKTGMFIFILGLTALMQMANKIIPPHFSPSIKETFTSGYQPFQSLEPLLTQISLETNWPAKSAMKRMYVIGIQDEISLIANYTMVEEILDKKDELASKNPKHVPDRPEGYFLIQHLKRFKNYTQKGWEKYLSYSSLLSNFLREEIKERKVLIQTPKLYEPYWLIPYKTVKDSVFVEGFSNVGQPYYWEEPEWLKNCSSTQHFQNKEDFYYCKVWKGFLQRAGVHIKIFTGKRRERLRLQFFGSPLGGRGRASNVDGYAAWSDMSIYLSCGEFKFEYNLPSSLGVERKKANKNVELQGKFFTTPLKISIPMTEFRVVSEKSHLVSSLRCKGQDLKEMSLKFTHFHNFNREQKKVEVSWKINPDSVK